MLTKTTSFRMRSFERFDVLVGRQKVALYAILCDYTLRHIEPYVDIWERGLTAEKTELVKWVVRKIQAVKTMKKPAGSMSFILFRQT